LPAWLVRPYTTDIVEALGIDPSPGPASGGIPPSYCGNPKRQETGPGRSFGDKVNGTIVSSIGGPVAGVL